MKSKLWKRLALATLLATGVAFVWGCLAGWVISLYQSKDASYRQYESIQVNRDGDAYISVSDYTLGYHTTSHKTLDGVAIEGKELEKISTWIPAALLVVPQPSQKGTARSNWHLRVSPVAATHDSIRVHS